MKPCSSQAYAKFIVSGEHAVLAGAPCLVYPLKAAQLRLQLSDAKTSFEVTLNGVLLDGTRQRKVFEAALLAGLDRKRLEASAIEIETSIPLGSGLGSSASLCVALARLAHPTGNDQMIFESALNAEALFHGHSSGADPAGVCAKGPLLYRMQGRKRVPFLIANSAPYVWVLRASGTEHASADVITATAKSPALSRLIEVSEKVPQILAQGEWKKLPSALESICEIHRSMGLVDSSLENAFATMRSEGAVATKLTGAGRGGFALGLFPKDAIPELKKGNFIVSLSGNDEGV